MTHLEMEVSRRLRSDPSRLLDCLKELNSLLIYLIGISHQYKQGHKKIAIWVPEGEKEFLQVLLRKFFYFVEQKTDVKDIDLIQGSPITYLKERYD